MPTGSSTSFHHKMNILLFTHYRNDKHARLLHEVPMTDIRLGRWGGFFPSILRNGRTARMIATNASRQCKASNILKVYLLSDMQRTILKKWECAEWERGIPSKRTSANLPKVQLLQGPILYKDNIKKQLLRVIQKGIKMRKLLFLKMS